MTIIKNLADRQVAKLLTSGAIGVLPSDTLYGVMAVAANQTAVARLYNCKPGVQQLGTVIAASIDQLVQLGLKPRYLKAVEHLWPNPLSVVIPVGTAELAYLHRGANGLAVRIPKDAAVVDLLGQTGPLLTTSAHRPDTPPATTLDQAIDYFGNAVDFYVQGGDLRDRQPSTIIRIVDDAIEVLRPGAIKFDNFGKMINLP